MQCFKFRQFIIVVTIKMDKNEGKSFFQNAAHGILRRSRADSV